MYLKQIIWSKGKNVFRDCPMWSEQSKHIAGDNHTTQKLCDLMKQKEILQKMLEFPVVYIETVRQFE